MYYSRFKTFCGWLTFNDEVVFVFLTVLFLFPTVATADFRQEYENAASGKSYPDSGNIDFADFGFIVEKWLGSGVPNKVLKGSFIQPWLVVGWAANNWSTEFGYMKSVYMEHIIWQWTVKTDSDNICYYPSSLGFAQQGSDLVGKSLQAAQVAGIEVWLGLNRSDEWWSNSNNETWLTNEFDLSKLIAQELWDIYGGTYGDTIAGFYMTMEMDNVNFQTTASQDRMKTVYKNACDYIHNNMNKPVMVAPFYNESVGQNPSQYAAMWGYILETAPIDVITVQDGIGVAHCTVATVGPWFEAMRDAIVVSRPQTQLWSDLETFSYDPCGPADVSRIIDQIDTEYDYVEKLTSFAFNHYQSPQQGHIQEYNDYKSYVDSLAAK